MAEDLRVKRTKYSIKKAFASLVNEKGFANVTVKEIAEKAIINRQTFYNYYQDKYDLTEQLNDEYLEQMKGVIRARLDLLEDDRQPFLPTLSEFYRSKPFSNLLKSREIILALLSIQYDNHGFKQRLEQLFVTACQNHSGISLDNLGAYIFGNFFITIITYILKSNQRPSDSDLKQLRKMLLAITK